MYLCTFNTYCTKYSLWKQTEWIKLFLSGFVVVLCIARFSLRRLCRNYTYIPNTQIYPYLFGHIVDFVPRLTSDWIKVFRSCDSSRKMATAGMEKENSTFQGCFTRLAADNQKFIEYRKFQGFCLKRWQNSQKQNWKVKKGRFTYFYVLNIGNRRCMDDNLIKLVIIW